MKIVGSLRALYEEQYGQNCLLKKRVDTIIKQAIEEGWHYERRLKTIDSYTLKIETGRFSPSALEDLFACTIVVENLEAIERATKLVDKYCEIVQRKPRSSTQTHKNPDAFPFDDLRLYVKLRHNPALPPEPINTILFEVQIKTYLQHAWSIATHDLIYKTSDISWAHQRIAFQTKALLESAETAISRSDALAEAPNMKKTNQYTVELLAAIKFLKKHWPASLLPNNTALLATTLISFMRATSLELTDLEDSLLAETRIGRGKKISNLSPYLIIIQSLLNTRNEKLEAFLTTSFPKIKFRVLLTSELTPPSGYPTIVEGNVLRA